MTEFIINHLWQSSCFAPLAGLLAFVLRKNSPKVRYWVWLSASLKFLVPFALLVSLGSAVPRPARNAVSFAAPVFPNTLVQITEPFSPTNYASVPAHTQLGWVPVAMGILWALGFFAVMLVRYRSWLGVRAALQAGTPIELPIPVRALITPGAEEPGVVGFLRPVLVLPTQLLEHLNPRQLDAVLAHELCHVRRRDNLFAAVHMIVETIFWFHPLVWWIGSRMVEERELACDEEVLRIGCEPTDYVEGILKVCRFYTESRLPCVSGVTGAAVKKRLRSILAGSIAHDLNGAKKAILAAIGLAALVVPIVIGVLTASVIRAQSARVARPKWEVVAIRRCEDGPSVRGGGGEESPGRLALDCVPVRVLIELAYGTFANGRADLRGYDPQDHRFVPELPIEGGPAWINSSRYQINAKAESAANRQMMEGPMMQDLLEDRFKLRTHRETKQIPVYALTVARGGPKLQPHVEGSCTVFDPNNLQPARADRTGCGTGWLRIKGPNLTLDPRAVSMAGFAQLLHLDRPVVDRTGIEGLFDMHLEFAFDDTTRGALPANNPDTVYPDDPTGGTPIFTAVQEQLGLKLEPAKEPSESLVIDSIERPSEN